ncbi:trypsin-like serine peptidase [Streptomyces gobiensis]|uniref:trypsin-like serine peptidase n=1 Tax=Streptomyces gobiensis TaxID=2875706 RepID=UPI001E594639|nr:hypothetical protein [Streptomyces gobiensis]UGY94011.1 hypothetical protein test1122_21375 [Streptomyces gobiensis]
MSSMRKAARRHPALAAAAVVAALAVTATACGPEDGGADADAKPSAYPTAELGKEDLGLPKDLPISLDDLKKWKDGGWENWDRERWLSDAKDFLNPIIKDLWDPDRMEDAEEPDRGIDEDEIEEDEGGGSQEDEGVTDPTPAKVQAKPVQTPYTQSAKAHGKIFMDTPKGQMVCSATVVKDPKKPGKSNLVATAGHCVHGGKGKGWFRNVVFVPGYNYKGLPSSQLESAPKSDVLPHGIWWASKARTTDHWRTDGQERGGKGAQQDFAMLEVRPEDGGGKSLEESVGDAVKVSFSTPKVSSMGDLTARGYPAAPPFDGSKMYGCTEAPSRLTINQDQPTMYRIGCTMTGGSSGGGWVAKGSGGEDELYSVTSIGPVTATWLAGPRLGQNAKGVFDAISK